MEWTIGGVFWLIVGVAGFFYFANYSVGLAILGWGLFMWPGLGLAIYGDDLFIRGIGLVIFIAASIPSFIDIRNHKKLHGDRD